MRKKTVFIVYLVALHLFVILVLAKSDFIEKMDLRLGALPPEITSYHRSLIAFQKRIDKNLRPGVVLLFGDSHVQGLAVSSISGNTVNYGIGGDTSHGLLKRMPAYDSIKVAGQVLIAIGYNDIKRRSNPEITANIRELLTLIPTGTPVLLNMVYPVDEAASGKQGINTRIDDLNRRYQNIAKNLVNVTYLEVPELSMENIALAKNYHLRDGVHLNPSGYEAWIRHIKQALLP